MAVFLLAFLGAFMLSIGGRAQMLTGRLSDGLSRSLDNRIERPFPLLVVAMLCAIACGAAMAWFGNQLAMLVQPESLLLLIAAAMGLGELELVWPVKSKAMQEPTRSMVAIAVVLVARQICDAPRLLVLAVAALQNQMLPTLIGGAAGGALAAAAGWWIGGQKMSRLPLHSIRGGFALLMIIAAASIALNNHYGNL